MTFLLELEALSAGYGRADVLHEVSLVVPEDTIAAVLGANGAGKTTLLNALAGAMPASRGRVRFAGVDHTRSSPWKRVAAGIALVPEGRQVFGSMTVLENLEVAGLVRAPGRSERLEQVMELFPRLRERVAQPAGTLSGGEQQMVAIGRALMTGPRLLLIDEMSAGLAPAITFELVHALTQTRQRGVSVLLVEQSPHFIAEAVDEVFLLNQGRMVASGTLDELGGAEAIALLYLGIESAATSSKRSRGQPSANRPVADADQRLDSEREGRPGSFPMCASGR